ncbi:MAG: hypothetical protein P4L35_17185 [Ignavibacteriaceae bacterium]|nr:hypothetical protein [Ignavibacteriaceae bacterium]
MSRLFLSYQLFVAQDLSLKPYITTANITGILTTLLPAVTSTFVLYICFIISFLLFIIVSHIKLRNNGWLFIISVIILITLPFEIYLMTLDYSIITQLNYGTFAASDIINLFVRRIKVLGSFPLIEIFCYLSFYYFILFRPLTKNEN